jgi:hypothetical protein
VREKERERNGAEIKKQEQKFLFFERERKGEIFNERNCKYFALTPPF